jgi:hypothetical protein
LENAWINISLFFAGGVPVESYTQDSLLLEVFFLSRGGLKEGEGRREVEWKGSEGEWRRVEEWRDGGMENVGRKEGERKEKGGRKEGERREKGRRQEGERKEKGGRKEGERREKGGRKEGERKEKGGILTSPPGVRKHRRCVRCKLRNDFGTSQKRTPKYYARNVAPYER